MALSNILLLIVVIYVIGAIVIRCKKMSRRAFPLLQFTTVWFLFIISIIISEVSFSEQIDLSILSTFGFIAFGMFYWFYWEKHRFPKNAELLEKFDRVVDFWLAGWVFVGMLACGYISSKSMNFWFIGLTLVCLALFFFLVFQGFKELREYSRKKEEETLDY